MLLIDDDAGDEPSGAQNDAPRPDLVLLDVQRPKYDGRHILETVKSDSALCDIPIVVLSTSAAEEDILRNRFEVNGSGNSACRAA